MPAAIVTVPPRMSTLAEGVGAGDRAAVNTTVVPVVVNVPGTDA